MWYVLIVILFSSNPADKPALLEPVAFDSPDKCQKASETTLQAIKDAHLDSIAAVALSCKAMSNPVTEKDADK